METAITGIVGKGSWFVGSDEGDGVEISGVP
jgi:hypothetical protein